MRTTMKLSTVRRPACVAVLALCAGFLTPVSARAQQAPWTAVPSPNATAGNNVLAAVSTVSPTDSWAVGQDQDANGNSGALIEHWDGTTWSVVASPAVLEGNLLAVSAISAANAWAVGSYLNGKSMQQALIEHWNGVRWTRVRSPLTGPGTVLNAITVVSRRDIWAVGESLADGITAQTLTEHWDGSTWAVVTSPNSGTRNNLLTGVAAVSSTDVWAVGHELNADGVFQTLTENWNGTSWSIVASPSRAGVQSSLTAVVTASDGRYIWAVGTAGNRPLIEQWSGTNWLIVPSPTRADTSSLAGVAIVNGSDVWAVGQSQDNTTGVQSTLIEQWNGLRWSTVPSPDPATTAQLTGVAADPSSGQVWAVGLDNASFSAQQTLTEFKP